MAAVMAQNLSSSSSSSSGPGPARPVKSVARSLPPNSRTNSTTELPKVVTVVSDSHHQRTLSAPSVDATSLGLSSTSESFLNGQGEEKPEGDVTAGMIKKREEAAPLHRKLHGGRTEQVSGIPLQRRESEPGKRSSLSAKKGAFKVEMVTGADGNGNEARIEESGESTYMANPSYTGSEAAAPESKDILQIEDDDDHHLHAVTPLKIRNKQTSTSSTPPVDDATSAALRLRKSFERAPVGYLRNSGSATSPPSTPPAFAHSIYSDTTATNTGTDRDSLRSSVQHTSWPTSISRKLDFEDQPPLAEEIPSLNSAVQLSDGDRAERRKGGVFDTIPVDAETDLPIACPIQREPELRGFTRRDSDSSDSTDFEEDDDDDDDEEEEDGDDVHDFSLEDFPVPNSVVNTPQPPQMEILSTSSAQTTLAVPTTTKSRRRSTVSVGVSPATKVSSVTVANGNHQHQPDLVRLQTGQSAQFGWDFSEELEIRDRVFRAEMKKKSRADRARRRELRRHFDQFRKPSTKELYEASLLSVRDENGHRVRFGSLFEGQRTIVCFIRTYWCSLCQDYVDDIAAKIKPELLEKHGMKLVIVGNGSWKMIKGYKKFLGDRCPYPIYSDIKKNVYTAMGMTLRTWNPGKGSQKGDYIKHTMVTNITNGFAIGFATPGKLPGDQLQIGGEFILGPGLTTTFTHRMKTTRDHAEIEEVMASVGIDLKAEMEAMAPTPAMANTPLLGDLLRSSASTKRASSLIESPSTKGISSNSPSTPKISRTPASPVMGGSPRQQQKTPGSPSALFGWNSLRRKKRDSKVPVHDLGISSATVFAHAQNQETESPTRPRSSLGIVGNQSEEMQEDAHDAPTPLAASKSDTSISGDKASANKLVKRRSSGAGSVATGGRRQSVPRFLETPPPSSPISTDFIASNNRGSSRTPSPLQSSSTVPTLASSPPLISPLLRVTSASNGTSQPMVPGASFNTVSTSAGMEMSASRFSSSSEESVSRVGALTKSIKMHLKVAGTGTGTSHGNGNGSSSPRDSLVQRRSVDNFSINSKGSIRISDIRRV